MITEEKIKKAVSKADHFPVDLMEYGRDGGVMIMTKSDEIRGINKIAEELDRRKYNFFVVDIGLDGNLELRIDWGKK